jgi:hypothetical protein
LEDQDVEDLIDDARRALARVPRRPADASVAAEALFLLEAVYGRDEDPRVIDLRERFHETLGGIEAEMLPSRVRHVSRLASAPGELIYEEMHKLFSLLDEVHALHAMGYSSDQAAQQQMDADVLARFATQDEMTRLIAEDKVKGWNRSCWWYAHSLRPAN